MCVCALVGCCWVLLDAVVYICSSHSIYYIMHSGWRRLGLVFLRVVVRRNCRRRRRINLAEYNSPIPIRFIGSAACLLFSLSLVRSLTAANALSGIRTQTHDEQLQQQLQLPLNFGG